MSELPDSMRALDRYFAAATMAHAYIADRHRELVELQAADNRSRALLHESAAIVFEHMPRLARQLREQERDWDEQQLLDRDAARRTLASMAAGLADIEPALKALRARQGEIAASMLERVQVARQD